MDAITAALNIAANITELILANYKALPADKQAAFAEGKFDRIERAVNLADKVLSVFHKDPAPVTPAVK